MPTRRLGWKTPLGFANKYSKIQEPKPKSAHLHRYGCRAYALRTDLEKLDRLEPRAHIGYLVGYKSSNQFKIWVPKLNRVIETRDVTFDESKVYSPKDDFEEDLEQIVQTIQVPELETEPEAVANPEISIYEPGDSIIVDQGFGIDHGRDLDRTTEIEAEGAAEKRALESGQLPTPESSPEPESNLPQIEP